MLVRSVYHSWLHLHSCPARQHLTTEASCCLRMASRLHLATSWEAFSHCVDPIRLPSRSRSFSCCCAIWLSYGKLMYLSTATKSTFQFNTCCQNFAIPPLLLANPDAEMVTGHRWPAEVHCRWILSKPRDIAWNLWILVWRTRTSFLTKCVQSNPRDLHDVTKGNLGARALRQHMHVYASIGIHKLSISTNEAHAFTHLHDMCRSTGQKIRPQSSGRKYSITSTASSQIVPKITSVTATWLAAKSLGRLHELFLADSLCHYGNAGGDGGGAEESRIKVLLIQIQISRKLVSWSCLGKNFCMHCMPWNGKLHETLRNFDVKGAGASRSIPPSAECLGRVSGSDGPGLGPLGVS